MKQSDLDKYTAETQSDGKIVLTPIKRCIQGTVWKISGATWLGSARLGGKVTSETYWCSSDCDAPCPLGSFDEVYVLRSDIVEALSHTDRDGCSVLDARGFLAVGESALRPTRQSLANLGFKVGQYYL